MVSGAGVVMGKKVDLSHLEDKELQLLGAAVYDLNAAFLRLIHYGLFDIEQREPINVGEIMDMIDGELKLRLQMKRALHNG